MLLSVITPIYNAAEYLDQCLDSVAALPLDHEHVVIDGGSTDGTVERLAAREDPRLRWVSEPDRGQTHAVNKGLETARGELLMWLNGDDELVPDGVAAAVRHLEAVPDCAVVYGGLDFTDASGELRRSYRPAGWSWLRYLLLGDYVPTPTFVFRAARWREVGPLEERWVDAADYDFYLRLTHGVRVDRMPSAHVRFRWHAASKSGSDVWTQQRDPGLHGALVFRRAARQAGCRQQADCGHVAHRCGARAGDPADDAVGPLLVE